MATSENGRRARYVPPTASGRKQLDTNGRRESRAALRIKRVLSATPEGRFRCPGSAGSVTGSWRRVVPDAPTIELDEELRDHLAREDSTSGRRRRPRRRCPPARARGSRQLQDRARGGRRRTNRPRLARRRPRPPHRLARPPPQSRARRLVVISLALGVGGTTAILSGIAHAVLFRPLPYARRRPTFLLRVWWNSFSSTLVERRPRRRARADRGLGTIAAFYTSDEGFTLSTPAGPQVVDGGTVTADLPAVLGAAPLTGPGLSATPAPEALISEGLWRERFGGRSDALGENYARGRSIDDCGCRRHAHRLQPARSAQPACVVEMRAARRAHPTRPLLFESHRAIGFRCASNDCRISAHQCDDTRPPRSVWGRRHLANGLRPLKDVLCLRVHVKHSC